MIFSNVTVYGFSRLIALEENLWALSIKAEVGSQMACVCVCIMCHTLYRDWFIDRLQGS